MTSVPGRSGKVLAREAARCERPGDLESVEDARISVADHDPEPLIPSAWVKVGFNGSTRLRNDVACALPATTDSNAAQPSAVERLPILASPAESDVFENKRDELLCPAEPHTSTPMPRDAAELPMLLFRCR